MTKTNNPFATYDYQKTAEHKHHLRVMERFRQLSLEEKLQTMVDAGILDEHGELTERYGGEASPTSPERRGQERTEVPHKPSSQR
ncbi:MAG: hypothetical protein AAFX99_29975 [Myxococcota bacterium]